MFILTQLAGFAAGGEVWGPEGTIDSYALAVTDDAFTLYNGGNKRCAQCITLAQRTRITKVSFGLLASSGAPPGNCYAEIWAITGTVGTTAVPTGSPLATSNAVVASGIGATPVMVEFTFATPYVVNAGGIALVFQYLLGNASNRLSFRVDTTSPTHAGNNAIQDSGSSWAASSNDAAFILKGQV